MWVVSYGWESFGWPVWVKKSRAIFHSQSVPVIRGCLISHNKVYIFTLFSVLISETITKTRFLHSCREYRPTWGDIRTCEDQNFHGVSFFSVITTEPTHITNPNLNPAYTNKFSTQNPQVKWTSWSSLSLTESATFYTEVLWWRKALLSAQLWYAACCLLTKSLLEKN